jgi:hypothetical protein
VLGPASAVGCDLRQNSKYLARIAFFDSFNFDSWERLPSTHTDGIFWYSTLFAQQIFDIIDPQPHFVFYYFISTMKAADIETFNLLFCDTDTGSYDDTLLLLLLAARSAEKSRKRKRLHEQRRETNNEDGPKREINENYLITEEKTTAHDSC